MEVNSKRVNQRVRNFERTIQEYQFKEPFSRFLTQFYKNNRQMGSSDRRMNSRLCYNYFRLGKAFSNLSVLDRLCIAEFLCEQNSAVVAVNKPDWIEKSTEGIEEKINFIEAQFGQFLDDVFPFTSLLSPNIEKRSFIISHFIQPNLYIRVQKGMESKVKKTLEKNEIPFEELSSQTLELPNGTNLQQLKSLDGDYEVQDWASQQSLNEVSVSPKSSWWDCCAASGGKSLLLLDKESNIKLLVSDVRLSILRNLDERFDKADVKTYYRKKILDLSKPVDHIMGEERFDGIIVDAPCSGSGTWGRTPEMLQKFKTSEIDDYSTLQKQIVKNVAPYLKSGKTLVYITCSVFAAENEEITQYITDRLGLELENQQAIIGYDKKADSMFVARFKKP
ncbi:RsmB/NOP family class I SAM-dependent RNA methyltransferase [Sphingobacterium daejeonense]|uniref:RsmB/NOP family class I SAM-dependent RNA methyltransferase n=1 Tax=Sphingobacterium daejeonense TaxID=371142 RepID=A0ABW3RJN4_9SPHI